MCLAMLKLKFESYQSSSSVLSRSLAVGGVMRKQLKTNLRGVRTKMEIYHMLTATSLHSSSRIKNKKQTCL